jgi:hypothetical protein
MMSTDTFHEAYAFLERSIADGPVVHVTLDDGSHLIGYVVAMSAPGAFVVERPHPARGEVPRIEIDLTRVSALRVILPRQTVRLFA